LPTDRDDYLARPIRRETLRAALATWTAADATARAG
jgi:hypothetical protein